MKTFNVGVKALILKDEKILILQDSGAKGYWKVPGGRIDADESIEATLKRELKEELPNISDIQIKDLVCAERVPHNIDGADHSLVLLFYEVEATVPGDLELDDEHSDHEWVDLQIAADKTIESISEAIKSYIKIRANRG